MISIDKHEVDFQCPNCNYHNSIQIRQARLRDVVICRGCKSNIRLDDQMNETRKFVRSIRRAINALEKALKGMSSEIRI